MKMLFCVIMLYIIGFSGCGAGVINYGSASKYDKDSESGYVEIMDKRLVRVARYSPKSKPLADEVRAIDEIWYCELPQDVKELGYANYENLLVATNFRYLTHNSQCLEDSHKPPFVFEKPKKLSCDNPKVRWAVGCRR